MLPSRLARSRMNTEPVCAFAQWMAETHGIQTIIKLPLAIAPNTDISLDEAVTQVLGMDFQQLLKCYESYLIKTSTGRELTEDDFKGIM